MADHLERVEGEAELKCEAHKFFDVWACKPHLIPNNCKDKITNVELQHGEWNKVGAIKVWTYEFEEDGISEGIFSITTKVEELDVENMTMRYSYHDGFILKNYYKTLKSKMKVSPKCQGEGCIVNWSFEYEKMNEDVPEPNKYIDHLLDVAKDVDAYCL